jgi:lipoate---protein ligase
MDVALTLVKFKQHTLVLGVNADTIENLAIENYLMNRCVQDEIILFLWQSDNTVVIGCHQNPYKECNLPLMSQNHVKLVKRRSGGGAVYHDLGNLNFSIITHTVNVDIDTNYQLIIQSLLKLGVDSTISGRNDLTAAGCKFSGNAFLEENGVHCHHGTLLIESSLELLAKYLTPSQLKLTSKGIDSVRSRVINLKTISNICTIETVKEQLVETFKTYYEGTYREELIVGPECYEIYRKQYNQWGWQVGSIPKFNIEFESRFAWGYIIIQFEVQKGVIQSCHLSTDALINEKFQLLGIELTGKQYHKAIINEVISRLIIDKTIRDDLNEMILI